MACAFKPAVLKLFGCWAKFATLSASTGLTIFRIVKKNSRHNINHVCVYCYLFSLFGNMFAIWLMKLLLMLHNSCNVWFHAWCYNTESTALIFLQQPDNAYASNSECLLQLTDLSRQVLRATSKGKQFRCRPWSKSFPSSMLILYLSIRLLQTLDRFSKINARFSECCNSSEIEWSCSVKIFCKVHPSVKHEVCHFCNAGTLVIVL